MWIVVCSRKVGQALYGPFNDHSDAALFAEEQKNNYAIVAMYPLTDPALAEGAIVVDINQITDYVDPFIVE